MKISDSVLKKAANTGGTFLGGVKSISPEFVKKVQNAVQKSLKAPGDPERAEILENLRKDLDMAIVTADIRESADARVFRLTQQELDWMERQPEELWADYLVYRYHFKIYPAMKKLRSFPPHLLIEPTSACNLRCIMCFQVDATFTVKENMGMMPWELFTSVVDQAKKYQCHAVTLASRGEPTLHPRFGDMLRYIHEAGFMESKVNTNATKLTEKLCHDILSSKISEVVFSVDAATKETYENIRVKGKFEEVVANIDRFNEIRKRDYPGSPTITRISGVWVSEEQNAQQMQDFWSRRVDQVTIKKATPRWDTYNNEIKPMPHPCVFLWERMYVWYDGKVNPCDIDYKSYLSPGNALQTPLTEIWLGEAYQKLRKDHLENRRSERMPCDRCAF